MRRILVAIALVGLAAPGRAAERDLRQFYVEQCVVCHGLDGTGRNAAGQRLGPRSLLESKADGEALTRMLLDGSGAMPAYRYLLTEAEARRMVKEVLLPLRRKKHR